MDIANGKKAWGGIGGEEKEDDDDDDDSRWREQGSRGDRTIARERKESRRSSEITAWTPE